MYSILIIVFFIILSFILSGIILCFAYKKDIKEIKNTDSAQDDQINFEESRLPLSQSHFISFFVFFIFGLQILIMFPLMLAFNRLHFLVFLEIIMIVFFMVISIFFAIQKNMLRIKE